MEMCAQPADALAALEEAITARVHTQPPRRPAWAFPSLPALDCQAGASGLMSLSITGPPCARA